MLRPMFSTVADTYDLANKVLTFGLDKRWRRACAQELATGKFVVDLCCGTGDLSSNLIHNLNEDSMLVGLDFSKEMLSKAISKNIRKTKRRDNYALVIADAAHLPLRKGHVDDIRISFSFRNLIFRNPQALAYLKEANCALKANGHFTCVETSQPKSRLLRSLFHLYCLRIIPFVGGLVSGRKSAYRYLGRSAAYFPFPKEILALIKEAGFSEANFKPLTFGIVGLYRAVK